MSFRYSWLMPSLLALMTLAQAQEAPLSPALAQAVQKGHIASIEKLFAQEILDKNDRQQAHIKQEMALLAKPQLNRLKKDGMKALKRAGISVGVGAGVAAASWGAKKLVDYLAGRDLDTPYAIEAE